MSQNNRLINRFMDRKPLRDNIPVITEKNNNNNNDQIKDSVIRPVKIQKKNDDISKAIDYAEKDYNQLLQKYWQGRTNQPYKNILRNENYNREFKSNNDLIVHRVTDKDKVGVEKDYKDFISKLDMHNSELKTLYSTSKMTENKKKFEYNHKYKYRVNYQPTEHSELKQDRITYYKNEQKKLEQNKEKIDDIIECLVDAGIINEKELTNSDKKGKYLQRQKRSKD